MLRFWSRWLLSRFQHTSGPTASQIVYLARALHGGTVRQITLRGVPAAQVTRTMVSMLSIGFALFSSNGSNLPVATALPTQDFTLVKPDQLFSVCELSDINKDYKLQDTYHYTLGEQTVTPDTSGEGIDNQNLDFYVAAELDKQRTFCHAKGTFQRFKTGDSISGRMDEKLELILATCPQEMIEDTPMGHYIRGIKNKHLQDTGEDRPVDPTDLQPSYLTLHQHV